MAVPAHYAERVYAGVLGKLIGVYLGRPFEGWTYDRIMAQLGEIHAYVHEKLGLPLIVTDDDISGTFTFVRALPDHGNPRQLSAAQIGDTWLNYIIERRSILWWGGRGNSTEHTAYLNLLEGIKAPQSGAMSQNSQVIAEQIGAQIFIDSWAMVAPGDPDLAVALARQAGSVSHDGEALYGAMVLAAMEAQAFVESSLNTLLDGAVRYIPKDSVIYRMIADIRDWHAGENDWRKTRQRIVAHYGYDRYGGNVHVVPNHALIIYALLYGADDFQKSLMIVNTSGWDTDCNSGNVGCLLGIKNGLPGLMTGYDFRSPVADRLYLPSADSGRAVTDAVIETYHLVNIGRALNGLDEERPKHGARFHFSLPGAVQGFQPENSQEPAAMTSIENVLLRLPSGDDVRALAVRFQNVTKERPARAATPTFIPPHDLRYFLEGRGYQLMASPTLYSGQVVEIAVMAALENARAIQASLYIRYYGENDVPVMMRSETVALRPGAVQQIAWEIPDTDSAPICEVGIEIGSERPTDGTLYIDWLTWNGAPHIKLTRPQKRGVMWLHAWVNALDHEERRTLADFYPEAFRLIQNRGRGMFIQGTREWDNYRVSAPIVPYLCKATGIAACVQGLRRCYALLLQQDRKIQLVKMLDSETVLAEAECMWEYGHRYDLALTVQGNHVIASLNDQPLFNIKDTDRPLLGGAVALVCEEGSAGCEEITIQPC